ncbi:dihydrofolate reductase [Bacteroides fragilis]|uniref:dihydrofolate reductase n=1 Tax=Bacteroides fragilis TaxID=817 RepID=UPI00202E6414|nr:dihydrofolate reductase [Bacteroides fragilis]MCM0363825.1 dihydrofolate reductase [Bacteroides fragilis]
MSKISIIAAVDHRMAIGFQNKLLFWLPNDLKRFKALTTGNTIIMGRKTFESLPKGALPNRRNVVLSSNPATECPGAEVFTSLEAALKSCQEEEKVYIIGGVSVYRQAMPLADELCLTEVDDTAPEADTFFPAVDTAIWHEKSREVHPADEKHLCSYAFVDYVRG